MRRLSLALAFALLLVVAVQPLAHASSSLEKETADLLNAERKSRGLPALSVRSDLTSVARAHSGVMADKNHLHHNPSLTTDVKNWRRLAENVGVGGSVPQVHTALMNSSGHKANILDYRVTEVGVGVVTRNGRVWITQVFRLPSGASVPSPPSNTTASYAGFYDVKAGSTHAAAIKSLVDKGITEGCRSGRYCPDQKVTRAQLATFLVRALPDVKPVSGRRFSDVAPGTTHASAIAALSDAGIIKGCGKGRFCPDKPVTRAQMATMLTRAFEWQTATPRFSDVPKTGTHSREIGGTAAAGVTKGCSTTRYCPKNDVTRAEMASFLDRALRR